MRLLAEGAANTATVSSFDYFDIFVIVFTILIAIGLFRSLVAPKKNKLAIGFGGISLAVFLLMDYVMVQHWMGNV